MGAAQNALNLLDVPTFYQYVVRGGILLVAVILDQVRQRMRAAAKVGPGAAA
jgi:L-arabinose transport system permease protein